MRLAWHTYKYFPYERELAAREVSALLDPSLTREVKTGLEVEGACEDLAAARLTYFSAAINGRGLQQTVQSRLEEAARSGKNRQATRYSVHGLHEYKGKFNPQVARALLNIFGVQESQRVLDPFCGSGTTLVECAHLGAIGVGADINPLAIYIANAKLLALRTPAAEFQRIFERLSQRSVGSNVAARPRKTDPLREYLASWFDTPILETIEESRAVIEQVAGSLAPVFLTIASDLLRDYSQQDPNDLRIRRRKSPLPEEPFWQAFLDAVQPFINRLLAAQSVVGINGNASEAIQLDVAHLSRDRGNQSFDAAITSPPYAMALPYIDTQRLSLVWLNLLPSDRILEKESELIGSREMRGEAKRDLPTQLVSNAAGLPAAEAQLCTDLLDALGPNDGFRRQAVPALLYRYFAAMKGSFHSVRTVIKPGAPYGLIVGHNHSTIGGVRRDIDTPSHLANLAVSAGWQLDELIPLQTYRRYGYHVSNAVAAETLILLRAA